MQPTMASLVIQVIAPMVTQAIIRIIRPDDLQYFDVVVHHLLQLVSISAESHLHTIRYHLVRRTRTILPGDQVHLTTRQGHGVWVSVIIIII
jgi:hypothetical protein